MNPDEPDLPNEVISDCATALRICDLARPGDTDSTLLSFALGHLEYCSNCRHVVRERERFDFRVASFCREIVPPVDGRERLLQLLSATADASPADGHGSLEIGASDWGASDRGVSDRGVTDRAASASVPAVPGPREVSSGDHSHATKTTRRPSRRRVLQAAVAAMFLLGTAGTALWFNQLPATSVDQILAALGVMDWRESGQPELLVLQNGQAVRLPEEMKTSAIQGAPRLLAVERVQTAVFFFQFSRHGARRVQAALAAVPVSQLSPALNQRRFLATAPVVVGDLCATTWVEGNTAYVCCVRGTPSDLQELALPRPAA